MTSTTLSRLDEVKTSTALTRYKIAILQVIYNTRVKYKTTVIKVTFNTRCAINLALKNLVYQEHRSTGIE